MSAGTRNLEGEGPGLAIDRQESTASAHGDDSGGAKVFLPKGPQFVMMARLHNLYMKRVNDDA